MTHEGSKVRVYALSGVPEGKTRLPGVLHVHGGGQTVNPQWLRFWNDRGYAALTFNWGGVWPGREKFTDWGKLTQGNHKDAGAMADGDEALGPGVLLVSLDPDLTPGADLPGADGRGRSRAAGRLRRLDGRHDRLADGGDGRPDQGGVCHLRRRLEHLPRRDRRPGPDSRRCRGVRLAAGDGAGVVRPAGEVPGAVPRRHRRPARQDGLGLPDAGPGPDRGASGVHAPLPPPHRRRAGGRPAAVDGRPPQGRRAVPEVPRRRGPARRRWRPEARRPARPLEAGAAGGPLLRRREPQPEEPLLAVGDRAARTGRRGPPACRSTTRSSPSSPSPTSCTSRASA